MSFNQQNQGGWGNQPPQQQQGGFNQPPQQQQQPQGENLYVGTGKLIEGQYGRFIRLSFKYEDLQQMLQHVNENGWVTLNLNPRQQPSANGATHCMKIDTWQPNQNQGGFQQQQGGYQQQGNFQQQQPQQVFQRPPQNHGGVQPPQQQPQGGWQGQPQQQPDNGGFGAPQMPAGAFDPNGQEDDIPF